MILNTIMLLVFLLSLFSTAFWQGPAGYSLVMKKTREQQDKFYLYNKKMSFIVTGFGLILVSIFGGIWMFGLWDLAFYLCFIPIAIILVKSWKLKQHPFEIKLFKNKFLEFIFNEVPVSYIYVIIWVKLLAIPIFSLMSIYPDS